MNCDWVKVEGESMRPVLRSGDWIGVNWRRERSEEEALQRLRPGDLILGRSEENLWLVHRLVRAEHAGKLILKGDASTMTETLTLNEVWGKVVAVRRAPGKPPSPLGSSWLDGWIAWLSRHQLRRLVFVLGWLRRASL